MQREQTSPIERAASTPLPTRFGLFQMYVYVDHEGKEHTALTVGTLEGITPVPTRLHSECLTGDVFGSHRCDCGEQLAQTMQLLQSEQRGVLIYLRQEGRGIGLANKIRAYALQDQGLDTVDANRALGLPDDLRDYRVAAEILADLGINTVTLITNNPAKINGLEAYGITVAERMPLHVAPNRFNQPYIAAKRERMGHLV